MKYLTRTTLPTPYIAICQSELKFREELKRLKIKDYKDPFIAPGALAMTHFLNDPKDGTAISVVCIKHNKEHDNAQIAALLVHEAMHVWQCIKEFMEETAPGHECEAYTVQSISLKLFDAYRPKLFK